MFYSRETSIIMYFVTDLSRFLVLSYFNLFLGCFSLSSNYFYKMCLVILSATYDIQLAELAVCFFHLLWLCSHA